jgi:hypothetical protein
MAAAARTSTAKPYPGSMRSLLRMNGYRGLARGKGWGENLSPVSRRLPARGVAPSQFGGPNGALRWFRMRFRHRAGSAD